MPIFGKGHKRGQLKKFAETQVYRDARGRRSYNEEWSLGNEG